MKRGSYIGLGGAYQHTVAFGFNYQAEPLVKLYAGSSLFTIDLSVTNLKRTPMEYLYMAHANFRPVDNGGLVYSADCTPASMRVRTSIPSHVCPGPQYAPFLQELSEHPEKHNILKPGLAFDPEVVFFIDYLADGDGWSHTMQVHPDGSADYIADRPTESSTRVCAGLAARPTRTRGAWCCPPPPSRKATWWRRRRATSSCSAWARPSTVR